MLFNSYIFIFVFLPISLFGFYFLNKRVGYRSSIIWLVSASFVFYGWWNPAYLILIISSIIFNFIAGHYLLEVNIRKNIISRKIVLIVAIAINLLILGYFKYANFFIDNMNSLTNSNLVLYEIILPLGISFYTFQQVTYLIDTYRSIVKDHSFINYCLFVTFFPQLIAGPIVHHKDMLPQFSKMAIFQTPSKNIVIGFAIFSLGLFKKVVLADGIGEYATPVFAAAESGVLLTFAEAWSGALAYTFQLYFDFSGYSDMAVGLGRMFGISLPINFNSPYKSKSIAEFWRKWHITLSGLIRDYLWDPISLIMARYAINNKYNTIGLFVLTVIIPVIFAFFWIGLWHGAGWNFILFGLIHGIYIVIFNLWLQVKYNFPKIKIIRSNKIAKIISWNLTFVSVVFAWVLFRAETFSGAVVFWKGMTGLHGFSISEKLIGNFWIFEEWMTSHGFVFDGFFHNGVFSSNPYVGILWILGLMLISLYFPNVPQIMNKYHYKSKIYSGIVVKQRGFLVEWRPTLSWLILISMIFVISVLGLTQVSKFLYFQF
jgi:alginate O-acetyltransferase complex protein AlgI